MGKYDSLRKVKRNKMLSEYRHLHPELSLDEIGKMFNISRQRVGAILSACEEMPNEKELGEGN